MTHVLYTSDLMTISPRVRWVNQICKCHFISFHLLCKKHRVCMDEIKTNKIDINTTGDNLQLFVIRKHAK